MAEGPELSEQSRRTRAQLLRAARIVFEADGFDGATIARIVEVADLARGTFYLHFDSKEEVLMELADHLGARISDLQQRFADEEFEALEQPHRADLGFRIEQSIRRFFVFYRRNARMMAVLEHVASHHPTFRDLRRDMRRRSAQPVIRLLTDLAADGLVSPELDPRPAAFALTGMVDRFAYVWFVLGEEFDEEAAVRTLTRLWMQAVTGAPVDAGGSPVVIGN